jgi:uncharacterized membrane protein YraQ (UPF0718 family)
MNTMASKYPAARAYTVGTAALVLIALAGLYYVKWNPYFHRAFVAAAQHSIGASIVSGKSPVAPPPSVSAALGYAWAYGNAIWQAMVLGLLLGAGVQALVPRDWLARVFGDLNFKSVVLAGVAGVPSMM